MSIYKYDEWLLNIKIITCNISDIILKRELERIFYTGNQSLRF
jgi:hypothetical protein